MSGYSHLGTAVLLQNAQQGRVPQAAPGQPHVGWTTPTTIYEKMRAINASAEDLNPLVQVHIRRPEWKTAWDAWFGRWKAFFQKYQSDGAKLGALFYTDELAASTEEHRRILEDFQRGYSAEKNEKGEPLPAPNVPVPQPLPPKGGDKEDEGFKIPWWGWLLGGTVLVVGGYYFFKFARSTAADMRAKHRALEGALPRLLPGGIGEAAAARASDPSRLTLRDPAAFVTTHAVVAEPQDLPQILKLT